MKQAMMFLFIYVGTTAFAGSDITTLPYWNVDLSKVECLGAGDYNVFFDGQQSTWIKSEQLTRLMKASALKSLYKIEVLGAVFVSSTGDMIFFGRRLTDNMVLLNKFAFGAFTSSSDETLDLLAQHRVGFFANSSGWDAGGYVCNIR